jgi:DNA sulfur modification protein DndB
MRGWSSVDAAGGPGTIFDQRFAARQTLVKLNAIPMMFKFTDWIGAMPEDREQRVLNKKRIPDITSYILDNEDGYIFSSITASYKCAVEFKEIGDDGLGMLSMDLQDAQFVINDGQHRCAAIAAAIEQNPDVADETISVLLFYYENRDRVQQMFSDLNRFVKKTSKSLDILYDKRDHMSQVTLDVCNKVEVFQGMVDKDAVSLPVRSEKLFTLAALYDAMDELLPEGDREELSQPAQVEKAIAYWSAVSRYMPDWLKVKNGHLRSVDLRQERISSHTIVLRALGGVGAELMRMSDWRERLARLEEIDWNKKNPEWQNVCIVANSVVSNRQSRQATRAYIKRHLGLPLSDAETRSLDGLKNKVVSAAV